MSTSLTARDKDILETLDRVRVATTSQLKALHFPGTTDLPFIRRIKILMELGAVHRSSLFTSSGGRPQYVYSRKKIKAGHLFVAHMVDIAEAYVRFALTTKTHSYTLDDWQLLTQLKQKGDVIPDATFMVNTPEKPYRFLVEVDKGTELLKAITEKFIKYRLYFIQQYEQQYGTNKGRVLFIAPSLKRLQHMKALCEQQGGRTRYWFTTMDTLKTNDVLYTPIWYKAGSVEAYSLL
jgi:hypothetical protein